MCTCICITYNIFHIYNSFLLFVATTGNAYCSCLLPLSIYVTGRKADEIDEKWIEKERERAKQEREREERGKGTQMLIYFSPLA